MSLGLYAGYLGLAPRSGGGGGAPTPGLVPVGSTWAWDGDGLTMQGVAPGINSPPDQFQRLIGLRLQPVPEAILAKGGSTIKRDSGSNKALLVPFMADALAAQVPDVSIHGPAGRNENVLSTDPGADPRDGFTTSVPLQDWYDWINYSYTKFVAYGGKLFVVLLTDSSLQTNENTYRASVWAAQIAHIAAMTALDSRVVLADNRVSDPTLRSIESPQYTHSDERGGYIDAYAAFSAIDTRVESKTDDECIDMIEAGTYRYMTGTQRDTSSGMTVAQGTAGALTGPGLTGSIATGKTATNTTLATGIAVSMVATSGGRRKIVFDFSAATATSAAGRIFVQDTSNQSVTGITPGQDIRTGAIVRAAGFRNMLGDLGNFGLWGSSTNSSLSGANETHALDKAVHIRPRVLFTTTTSFAPGVKRGFGISFVSGETLAGKAPIEMERFFSYLFSNRTAAAPVYIGDIADNAGVLFFAANYRMQPRGTFSATTGGTIRVEPGRWNLGGLTEADFATRRIYRGGSGGAAGIGTGTLMATITGSTWTAAPSAQGTAGDLIYVEVDCNNGVGSTVTARSSVSITIAA